MRSMKGLFVAAVIAVCFGLCFRPVRAYANMLYCDASAGLKYTQQCGGSVSFSDSWSYDNLNFSESGSASVDTNWGVNKVFDTASATGPQNTLKGAAFGSGSSTSEWSDEIKFIDPASLSIQLQITYNLDALASANPSNNKADRWTEAAQLVSPGYILPNQTLPAGWSSGQTSPGQIFLGYNNQSSSIYAGTPSTSLAIDTTVEPGYWYSISAYLGGTASAWSGYASMDSATLNASDTGLYTIQILTPGASYTDDSGQIYDLAHEEPTSSVPEPPTFVLLSLGLVGMAVWGVKSRMGRTA